MNRETVTAIKHYSDRLFSFRTTRDPGFRFKNGEFAMIGLDVEPRPIFRAYSMVSTCYEEELEFLSIKVPDGPLTSRLQHIQVGDEVLVKPKTTGSLCIDYLEQRPNLVLLSTGTGIAPFMSIVRDPETYDKYSQVFLYHTVREVAELSYLSDLRQLEGLIPEFHYVESVTREDYQRPGRFWQYIEPTLGHSLDPEQDAIMVCGSPELNRITREQFEGGGWREGNQGEMGSFLLERAFAD